MWGLPGLSAVVTGLIAASLVWHTLFVQVRTADTALTVFGAVYTGFLLAYFVLVRSLDAGLVLSIVLIASVWANDVGAFFIGSLLGKHRLAPHISPKKSWEGFLAGVGGSLAVWAMAAFIPASGITLVQALVTGLAVGLASVIGDLAESRMKREAGVKDSGTSLPGHGGFLDRLDSLIFVCLVAYWVLWWAGVR
jgi:phosphatidate cytidylyltransferase